MNTAVVTGATSGLGREIALDLARRGWRLVLPVRTSTRAKDVEAAAETMGAPAPWVVECDLSDHVAVRQMCHTVAGEGRLDLVVNNAAVGGGVDPTSRQTNAAGVELRMAVNAATPHLIAQELSGALTAAGRIVLWPVRKHPSPTRGRAIPAGPSAARTHSARCPTRRTLR
jgi:NAD(P)-dependent dehydrogenase (short-subunit alcohol dehydrogenase family)